MNASPTPLRIWVDGTEQRLRPAGRFTIGRTPDNNIVIIHPLVSRQHLAIEWHGSFWSAVDLGSTNGLYLDGVRMRGLELRSNQRIRLGDATTGPLIDIAVTAPVAPGGRPMAGVPSGPMNFSGPMSRPAQSPPPSPRQPYPAFSGAAGAPHLQALHQNMSAVYQVSPDGQIHPQAVPHRQAIDMGGSARLSIGRTPDNDIVVNDVLASRRHARLLSTPQGLAIEDLQSVNGTYVNGQRISRQMLAEGAVVTIGNSDFVVSGGTLIRGQAQAAVADGLHVHTIGLNIDGKQLLHDVEFAAGPGTLTAVIGPSGAGKSTVSKIVAGAANPSTGSVTFEGRSVHAEYEALRTRIGMVPQDDVLHRRLTLRQALRYAAELRLPPDMSRSDRDNVITGVLAELQLTEHLDTRVDKLSGGQRKRASVAMELLTGPSLLILDEPTSGLDPALDRQVMSTLRRLADAGRVVIVVTHSLTYLSMCDQVLLLAPGGKTAFCGPPAAVGAAMGTEDWAEIFAFVADQPDAAHHRYRSRNQRPPNRPPSLRTGSPVRPPQTSFGRQTSTVSRRQVRLILADTGYLAFLVLLPIVLGALSLVIPGKAGFGLNNDDSLGETVQILVVLVVGASFMGAALTVRDLVGERAIFVRERAVGLRPGAYLLAKMVVFFVVSVLQCAVMIAITYSGKGTPGPGLLTSGAIELFVAVAFLACVSTLIGLAISAAVNSSEQTMPPLVVVVMVQLVFCGGLFPLAGRPGLEQLSWIFPARWGYAAAAAAVDLRQVSPGSPSTQKETIWDQTAANVALAYGAMTVIGLLLVWFTYRRLVLKKKTL
ncbi:FHA domain-containing protein [Williamsia sp. 1135]|uniref:FHA domain-containing protein n=1 Tax=Williamsia sp. 1135 TaxID=1889262 RepID=UPI000A1210F9|nr:FHA domain-containing protein [Williamsia sp. 1135]ORM24152.1 ABC transporter [Williamsia sp. 1135]